MEPITPLQERVREMKEYTTTTVKLHFTPDGWAIFHIDETSGSLAVQSDWGDYSYCWGHGGRGDKTLRQFLATCSYGYIAGKLSGGLQSTVPDGEKTKAAMLKYAAEQLEEGLIDAEAHEDLVEEIEEFARALDSCESGVEHYIAGDLVREFIDPLHEYICYELDPRKRFLMEQIIPTFQAYLRGEVRVRTSPDG